MPLYTEEILALKPLKEAPFQTEKEIQALFENNLALFTGLELIKSEFVIDNRRIDTLAFDNRLKAFAVIEYKLTSSYSMIDQGFAYYNLMQENKAEFILNIMKGIQNH
jgi:RecB family endonuclease NucS